MTTITTTAIAESGGTVRTPTASGRMLVQLITPGTGSSGIYTAEVLEAAATAGVFPAGTLMFADHPGASESRDRPERSIRDVAGVLTEAARWDGTALVAEARTYEPWTEVLAQMHESIGVSIRGSARVEESDAQGRPIIAELVEGISVDFVTYPGRGGAIREVYESRRPAVQVVEALPGDLTASDLERRLEQALPRGTYPQDYTDEWVVWNDYRDDMNSTFQQTYTADDAGRITLTGEPVQVSRRVTYDAVNLPSDPAGITQESRKGPDMGQIQIDEAEHARLTETAQRVTALESERDTAVTDRDAARAQLAEAIGDLDDAQVEKIIAAAQVAFSALEKAGLTASTPTTESGRLDVAAFEKIVAEAAAEKSLAAGEGRPQGVGHVAESNTPYTEEQLDAALGIHKIGA